MCLNLLTQPHEPINLNRSPFLLSTRKRPPPMNSIKCSKCGLSNFESDAECRRCGQPLFGSLQGPRTIREKPAKRFSVISLVIYAALAIGGYYLYQNFKQSFEEVNKNDNFRVAQQPAQKPGQTGLTRTEADRQHSNQVGNSLKENPSLAAQRQHNEDTQKAMQQASNSQH